MRVPELKALARDHGLRNYSRMRKAELVALLQNNDPLPTQRALEGLEGGTWDDDMEPMDDDRKPRAPPNKKWIYLK